MTEKLTERRQTDFLTLKITWMLRGGSQQESFKPSEILRASKIVFENYEENSRQNKFIAFL